MTSGINFEIEINVKSLSGKLPAVRRGTTHPLAEESVRSGRDRRPPAAKFFCGRPMTAFRSIPGDFRGSHARADPLALDFAGGGAGRGVCFHHHRLDDPMSPRSKLSVVLGACLVLGTGTVMLRSQPEAQFQPDSGPDKLSYFSNYLIFNSDGISLQTNPRIPID